MATKRVSTLDLGYKTGMLSVFPQALDSHYQLYTATNNCETALKQSLTYAGTYIVVDDNSKFPSNGLLRVGPPPGKDGAAELIYYDTKTAGVFRNLIRGFAGSRQNPWPIGSWVTNAVFAEHHNACKDALIQIETDLGTETLPDPKSLNGILKAQETRFLAPRPLFRGYPLVGAPPLAVRFQNFSTGPLVRYLWDFGEGMTSVEKSPIHIYQKEGIYSVKLNIITSLGAQGVVTKSNYITVSEEERPPFFYVTPQQGYSVQTATAKGIQPTTFTFVDQTDGDILQRYWIFDGPGRINGVEITSQSIAQDNPNIHTTTFQYDVPGNYEPSLLVLFDNQNLKRAFLKDTISVS
jgi:PKD repeat protein